jgi:hypothetical protein
MKQSLKIGNENYQAHFTRKQNEVCVSVYGFRFPYVYGSGATEVERIENAKSNFKLQVETQRKLEVVWVE